jgi:hypothetical protein
MRPPKKKKKKKKPVGIKISDLNILKAIATKTA